MIAWMSNSILSVGQSSQKYILKNKLRLTLKTSRHSRRRHIERAFP